MRKTAKAFLIGVIVIALGFGTSVSANAAEAVSTEDVVTRAQDAVGIDASLMIELAEDADGIVSTADGGFTVAQSKDNSLEIASLDSAVTLVIEDSDGASFGTADGMAIADSGSTHAVDYAVTATSPNPIAADPQWWDNVKTWFKKAGSAVKNRAMSAAKWLGNNLKWLAGKTWTIGKRGGELLIKKVGPGALVLCAVGAGWAWCRSDANGWVRVGDAVAGCFL